MYIPIDRLVVLSQGATLNRNHRERLKIGQSRESMRKEKQKLSKEESSKMIEKFASNVTDGNCRILPYPSLRGESFRKLALSYCIP